MLLFFFRVSNLQKGIIALGYTYVYNIRLMKLFYEIHQIQKCKWQMQLSTVITQDTCS